MTRKMSEPVAKARTHAIVAHRMHDYGDFHLPYQVHLDGTDLALVMGTTGSRCPTDDDERQAAYLHDVIEDDERGADLSIADLLNAGISQRVIAIVLFCTDEPGYRNRRERKAATYARMWRDIQEALTQVQPAPAPLPVALSGARVKLADRIDNLRAGFRDDDSRILMYLDEHEAFRGALVEGAPWMRRLLLEYDCLIAHMQCEPPIRQAKALVLGPINCAQPDFWGRQEVGNLFTWTEDLPWETIVDHAVRNGVSVERCGPKGPATRHYGERTAQVIGKIRPRTMTEPVWYSPSAKFWRARDVGDVIRYTDTFTVRGIQAAAQRNGREVNYCAPGTELYERYGDRTLRVSKRIRKVAAPCPTCGDTGTNPKATSVGGGIVAHPLGELGHCVDCADVPRRRQRR